MKLQFLGATGTVTGSRYLLTDGDTQLLIDCGLYQGTKKIRQRNWQPMPVDENNITAVLLTHAHLDHSGYIPRFIKEGFDGNIYCTEATHKLCEILLPDSGYLQEEEAFYANRKKYSSHDPALPLYTEEEARASLHRFKSFKFSQSFKIDHINIRFAPAGHILGASSIHIDNGQQKIVFSGDVGRPQDPVMRPPVAIGEADYLIVESTYGDRLHAQNDVISELAEIVKKTAARGGVVLIPSFAVGRAQMIMYLLTELKRKAEIPELPIFLDSPMAVNASQLFYQFHKLHRLTHEQCLEMSEGVKLTRTVDESKTLSQLTYPAIIISASGMLTGGRILHHMKSYAPDKRNTIVLVGFQAFDTRGYHLEHNAKTIRIHGSDISVNADVVTLDGLSAHADYSELTSWLKTISGTPRKVFITHGEPEAANQFKLHLEKEFNWSIEVPEYLSSYDL